MRWSPWHEVCLGNSSLGTVDGVGSAGWGCAFKAQSADGVLCWKELEKWVIGVGGVGIVMFLYLAGLQLARRKPSNLSSMFKKGLPSFSCGNIGSKAQHFTHCREGSSRRELWWGFGGKWSRWQKKGWRMRRLGTGGGSEDEGGGGEAGRRRESR